MSKFIEFLQGGKNKKVLMTLVVLAVLFFTFSVGVFVGMEKERFSGRWGDNYHLNFGGPPRDITRDFGDRGRLLPPMMGDNFVNPHGVAGTIMKIDGNTIIIKGTDNIEKAVVTDDKTFIVRNMRENIKVTDLNVDDSVVIIGGPNDSGQILAKLIRVFPADNSAVNNTATSTAK